MTIIATSNKGLYGVQQMRYTPDASRPGHYVEWQVKGGEFSMSAAIGEDQWGQCVDTLAKLYPNDAQLQRMVAVWERWHLNYLRAGTPAQEAYLRAHPVQWQYPGTHYDAACAALAAAGLNPDGGYLYGHAWFKEALPAEILAEIASWEGV